MIQVAILGFGNVGRAFAAYLLNASHPQASRLKIVAVADSGGGLLLPGHEALAGLLMHKREGWSLQSAFPLDAMPVPLFLDRLRTLGNVVLVDALPTNLATGQPSLDWLVNALRHGTSVVTVNKGPLVRGFDALLEAAQASSAGFAYNGATGVRPPEALAGDIVTGITGVLNGTTNYILTQMASGRGPLSKALAEAQFQGIAEPDPTFDLQGWDTACKILILAKAWMGCGCDLEAVQRKGMDSDTERLIDRARESGRVVRLLARAFRRNGRLVLSAAPEILGPESPFFRVSGASKAAVFHTERLGEVFVEGDSGRNAVARTILEDVLAVARGPFPARPAGA